MVRGKGVMELYIPKFRRRTRQQIKMDLLKKLMKEEKMKHPLKGIPTEVLLMEILQRSKKQEAPISIEFYQEHFEFVIGIGKDRTASLYLQADDIEALKDLCTVLDN